jgi:NADP-dependent aldehyde dehydrogenase
VVNAAVVRVSVSDLLAQRELLLGEAFGPMSILVEYESEDELVHVADQLFEGNLTGTVHAAAGEDTAPLRALIHWRAQHSGRVLFGGWPTGVAVTPAMQHGGPWPATTNDSGTAGHHQRQRNLRGHRGHQQVSAPRQLPGRATGAAPAALARR